MGNFEYILFELFYDWQSDKKATTPNSVYSITNVSTSIPFVLVFHEMREVSILY